MILDLDINSIEGVHDIARTSRRINRVYGCSLVSHYQSSEQSISYEMHLHTIEQRYESSIVSVVKKDVRVNNSRSYKSIDYLAVHCASVLYPLQLLITDKLEILDLVNHQEICKRWEIKKKELEKEFAKNDFLKRYLYQMEVTLLDKRSVLNSIAQDLFFHTLRNSMYRGSNSARNEILLPMVPNTSPISYEVFQKSSKRLDENSLFKIQLKGKVNDPRSPYEIATGNPVSLKENNDEVLKGSYKGSYQLEPTGVLRHAKFIASVLLPFDRSRTLEFTCYFLPEKCR
ncbi:hypothetical protein ACFQ1M_00710 [Sungkyunkwania multivorans]|uniref:Uncharacterized protein n=1 Tax=Sungkyunkwania multivorans TaxID=1173618 RepID=A0ABW3CTD4_9FLAO